MQIIDQLYMTELRQLDWVNHLQKLENPPYIFNQPDITTSELKVGGLNDFELADKVVRRNRKSIIAALDYNCEWMDFQDRLISTEFGVHYQQNLRLRKCFYDNQIRGSGTDVINAPSEFYDHFVKELDLSSRINNFQNQADMNKSIHNSTIVITFDGPKGSGKNTLAKVIAQYLMINDPTILQGRSGYLPVPIKMSEFLSESFASQMRHHEKKIKEGERSSLPLTDMEEHLLQYAWGLQRLAYELPPVALINRSHLDSLTKGSSVLAAQQGRFFSSLPKHILEGYERNRKGDSALRYATALIGLSYPPWDFESQFRRLAIEFFLNEYFKDRYIVPDLSVILLCSPRVSASRQGDREAETGRMREPTDSQENEWYNFFARTYAVPNALYLLEESSVMERFKQVILTIKERCEDKGGKHAQFAEKITPASIQNFLERGHLPLLK